MLSYPDFKEKQIVLALLSHKDKLSFKNDNIIIKDEEKKIKHQSSCYRLFSLFIVGHCSMTTGLLQRAKKFGFSIVFMSHNLKPYAHWNSASEGNTLLRKKQYNYVSLDIAKKLMENKIYNQIRAIKKIRNRSEQQDKSIIFLENCKQQLFAKELHLKEILGIEGIASKVYFQNLFENCLWKARRPRAKIDTINTLLDIGYTLLFNFIEGLVHLYGFDVYQGVYHQPFYKRKSLICDLVEPFRPIIDYRLRKAYNLNQVKVEDFTKSQYQYYIFGKKALPYLGFFIEELISNKKEIFHYIQSYYRAFMRGKAIEDYPSFDISSGLEGRKAC